MRSKSNTVDSPIENFLKPHPDLEPHFSEAADFSGDEILNFNIVGCNSDGKPTNS